MVPPLLLIVRATTLLPTVANSPEGPSETPLFSNRADSGSVANRYETGTQPAHKQPVRNRHTTVNASKTLCRLLLCRHPPPPPSLCTNNSYETGTQASTRLTLCRLLLCRHLRRHLCVIAHCLHWRPPLQPLSSSRGSSTSTPSIASFRPRAACTAPDSK